MSLHMHCCMDVCCLQALCDSNPDIHLKKVYETRLSASASSMSKQQERPLSPPPSTGAVGGSTKLLSVEKGPCEYCQELIPLSELIKHEVYII